MGRIPGYKRVLTVETSTGIKSDLKETTIIVERRTTEVQNDRNRVTTYSQLMGSNILTRAQG